MPGHTVVYGKPLGANGSYSNVACLSPNGAVKIWDLIEKDYEKAKELEAKVLNFMKQYILPFANKLSNTGLDKLLASVGGWGPVSEKVLGLMTEQLQKM